MNSLLDLPDSISHLILNLLVFADLLSMRQVNNDLNCLIDSYLEHKIITDLASKASFRIPPPFPLRAELIFLLFEFNDVCRAHKICSFEAYLKVIKGSGGWHDDREDVVQRRRSLLSEINLI